MRGTIFEVPIQATAGLFAVVMALSIVPFSPLLGDPYFPLSSAAYAQRQMLPVCLRFFVRSRGSKGKPNPQNAPSSQVFMSSVYFLFVQPGIKSIGVSW